MCPVGSHCLFCFLFWLQNDPPGMCQDPGLHCSRAAGSTMCGALRPSGSWHGGTSGCQGRRDEHVLFQPPCPSGCQPGGQKLPLPLPGYTKWISSPHASQSTVLTARLSPRCRSAGQQHGLVWVICAEVSCCAGERIPAEEDGGGRIAGWRWDEALLWARRFKVLVIESENTFNNSTLVCLAPLGTGPGWFKWNSASGKGCVSNWDKEEEPFRRGTAVVSNKVWICTRLGEPGKSQSLCFLLVKWVKYVFFSCKVPALIQRGTVLSGFLVMWLSFSSWEDLLLKWTNTIFILSAAQLPLKLWLQLSLGYYLSVVGDVLSKEKQKSEQAKSLRKDLGKRKTI